MKYSFCSKSLCSSAICSRRGPGSPWKSRQRDFFTLLVNALSKTEDLRLEAIDVAVPDGRWSSGRSVFEYGLRAAHDQHTKSFHGYGGEPGFYVDAHRHRLF